VMSCNLFDVSKGRRFLMNRFWLCTGQESRRREHQELSISLSVLTDGEPDEEERRTLIN
jgi:hypothetical protein